MRFDTKIAVVVLGELPTWQKLNVVAFTASGVAVSEPGMTGEPYEDGSGNRYLPMFRQPVLVFEAGPPSSPGTSSPRAMTRPTAPPCGPRSGRSWSWWGWPSTGIAPPWTRSSRA